MIRCTTFDTLLRRHDVRRIDLLQIDVEGYDYEILNLVDFGRMRPKLIRYERCCFSRKVRNRYRELLTRNGDRLLEMRYDTGAILRNG